MNHSGNLLKWKTFHLSTWECCLSSVNVLLTAVEEKDSNINTTTAGGLKQTEADNLRMRVSGCEVRVQHLQKESGFRKLQYRERKAAVS